MNKKLGIMQPYFFPYLGYWQLLNAVDEYVIYDDVNFIKNGWINRNNILLNGNKHLLTLPLNGASSFLLINQIKTTSNIKEKEKILKTLDMAYKKAPFQHEVLQIVEDVIFEESGLVGKALIKQMKLVCKYLGIDTKLLISSEIKKDNTLKAQDKVLHICDILNATDYINAIGGQELYSKTEFAKHNINLKFLKMNPQIYLQFKNEFVSNLSIIDVMMFNSPEKIKDMLDDYELL